MSRERRLAEVVRSKWMKFGIFAHGTSVFDSFVVPDDVAIVFLTQAGDYCVDPYVNMMMMSEPILNDFVMQKARVTLDRKESYPLFSVTYLPGDRCPQLLLDFAFDNLPEGIWRLPVARSFPIGGDPEREKIPDVVLNTAAWSLKRNKPRNYVSPYKQVDDRSVSETEYTLEYVVNTVMPRLSKGRPAVVYVTSCRHTDANPRELYEMNKKVSLVPMEGRPTRSRSTRRGPGVFKRPDGLPRRAQKSSRTQAAYQTLLAERLGEHTHRELSKILPFLSR
jgi:hypothetical protein